MPCPAHAKAERRSRTGDPTHRQKGGARGHARTQQALELRQARVPQGLDREPSHLGQQALQPLGRVCLLLPLPLALAAAAALAAGALRGAPLVLGALWLVLRALLLLV